MPSLWSKPLSIIYLYRLIRIICIFIIQIINGMNIEHPFTRHSYNRFFFYFGMAMWSNWKLCKLPVFELMNLAKFMVLTFILDLIKAQLVVKSTRRHVNFVWSHFLDVLCPIDRIIIAHWTLSNILVYSFFLRCQFYGNFH